MTERGRSRRGAGALVLSAALLLAGCAGDARDDLRDAVADLTADANSGDAAAVRSGVDAFLLVVDRAVRDGEIDTAEGVRLAEIAQRLRAGADALEVVEPTPEPTTESPTPSPTPTEDDDEDEQTPSPAPPPTTAPPTVLPELSPAAATGSVPTASPSPTASATP